MLYTKNILHMGLFLLLVSVRTYAIEPFSPLEDQTPLESTTPLEYSTDIIGDIAGGVVADRTITRMGKNFYQYFSQYWMSNFPNSHAALTVYELPSARSGSQIWIDYKGIQLFRHFTTPSNANNIEYVQEIARRMQSILVQIQMSELQMDTFDLAHGEL
ncbi:CsgE family curli-type amyloid fiber assembly protein [Idiomarina abyssalis]|uniref:CsgE family curli-type amyloid fiber assembly protein n=1 Tax=Idiomarina abyssalis TaxID=86102 RepID=UPI003A8D2628